ncbi:MAG TPA: TonB-dependent receptor [Bryobacteraceae bacterium]|nr:TonB-dependent receptor [Bryobacteraceae bacterium]
MIRVLLILTGSLCMAQESIHYASLSGRVSDPTGAGVEGARITARDTRTNLTSTTTTDREGRFRFSYLKPGPCEVKASQPGFANAVRTLNLTVGSAFEMPLVLAVASAEESITVSGEGSLLEAARTQIAGTVSQIELRALPLNGRNFLDLALLVPGVSPTNTGSNQLFAETSAVPGQGISVGGQRNFSNNFIVDGLSANDDAAGLSGVFYGFDVVDQFQVVTSGGQAEFGRALGGYMNVITKSGTNSLHGDLYGYFRNQRLNSSNALLHAALPLTQSQYGAGLGGPVLRDRTFFFANFEQRLLNQSGLITISPSDVAAINGRLAAAGYRGPSVAAGLYPNPVHNTNFLGKLDHQFSSKDQFAARYSLYDVNSLNSRGAGALNAASASAGLDNRDQTVAVSNIVTFSSRLVNETRGQYTRSNLQAPPADPVGPAVAISGVATLGRMSGAPTGRINHLYEIADNVSYQAGAHAFRAGIDVLHNHDTITYPRAAGGSYAFSSLANFLGGSYNNSGFTQTFGNPVVSQNNPNLGLFAQDQWKLGSRLTLNLGLRYDLQYLTTIATDTNNVSPRAGFAWSPFQARQTVVRGSYGLFYDRVPLRALANALLSANNTTDLAKLSQISVSLSPAQAGAPVFPNILGAAAPPVTLPNLTTMDPRMQNAYSQQGSLEIEQQVGSHGALSAGYQYLRGIRLIASINQNVPACVATGSNNGCRPNPNYANNGQYSPAADSNYNGLHISFLQRPARWGSYRISYTYSKALDNVGEFFFSSPIDPYNIWRDYGRSDDDQRHRLVFNGTVHTSMAAAKNVREWLVNGFQLSGMLQYYSSLPLNIASGTATVQGTAARPLVNGGFIGRNTGRGVDFFNLNVRLSRSFHLSERLRLDSIAEMFNALNHTNAMTLNGTFGPGAYPGNPLPSFWQITAVAEPRSIQLALRLTF